MIQRIHRTHHELNIPLRIDVIQSLPRHLAHVLHVHILIHHHDALAEHRLPQSPNRMHNLARMQRVAFPDRHQDQIMEDALGRHADVAHFRQLQPHQRKENPLNRLAHVEILHGRRPHDGGRIHRLLPVRDALDVKHRVAVLQRIESGVVPERPFDPRLR